MTTSTHLFLLLIISFIFNSHAISPSPSPSPSSLNSSPKLYQIVCKDSGSNDSEQKCLKLLESNSRITSSNDYLTLCTLYLEMAIEKATEAQNHLKSLIKEYPSSEAIKKCANNNYNFLIGEFRIAIPQLTTKPDGASWEATSAFWGPNYCDNNLASEKLVIPSVSKLNDEMRFLCFIAGVALDHLVQ